MMSPWGDSEDVDEDEDEDDDGDEDDVDLSGDRAGVTEFSGPTGIL
jgi:hypothetical protein